MIESGEENQPPSNCESPPSETNAVKAMTKRDRMVQRNQREKNGAAIPEVASRIGVGSNSRKRRKRIREMKLPALRRRRPRSGLCDAARGELVFWRARPVARSSAEILAARRSRNLSSRPWVSAGQFSRSIRICSEASAPEERWRASSTSAGFIS